MILAEAKHFYKLCVQLVTLRGKYYANACATLNARTAPVAFAMRTVFARIVFLISLVLE